MCISSIQRVMEWAESQQPETIEREVADFVLAGLHAMPICPHKLAAIQRSFEPIDDAGTLRMEVNRHDVAEMLQAVVSLSMKGVAGCRGQCARSVEGNAQPSEPESMAIVASDTLDAASAITARQELNLQTQQTEDIAIATPEAKILDVDE